MAYNTNVVHYAEVYPTAIRDIAVGFFEFSHTVGDILGQIIFLWITGISIFIPYYFLIFLLSVGMILYCFIRYETVNTELKDVLESK